MKIKPSDSYPEVLFCEKLTRKLNFRQSDSIRVSVKDSECKKVQKYAIFCLHIRLKCGRKRSRDCE